MARTLSRGGANTVNRSGRSPATPLVMDKNRVLVAVGAPCIILPYSSISGFHNTDVYRLRPADRVRDASPTKMAVGSIRLEIYNRDSVSDDSPLKSSQPQAVADLTWISEQWPLMAPNRSGAMHSFGYFATGRTIPSIGALQSLDPAWAGVMQLWGGVCAALNTVVTINPDTNQPGHLLQYQTLRYGLDMTPEGVVSVVVGDLLQPTTSAYTTVQRMITVGTKRVKMDVVVHSDPDAPINLVADVATLYGML